MHKIQCYNCADGQLRYGRVCRGAWLAVRGAGELCDESWSGHWNVDPKTGAGSWLGNTDENRAYILERMHVPDVQKNIEAKLSRPAK